MVHGKPASAGAGYGPSPFGLLSTRFEKDIHHALEPNEVRRESAGRRSASTTAGRMTIANMFPDMSVRLQFFRAQTIRALLPQPL